LVRTIRGKLPDINAKIDEIFKKLEQAFPGSPFVYLFWSDAVRIPSKFGVKVKGKRAFRFGSPGGGYPVSVMESAFEKLQRAYTLTPDLPVISSRICGLSIAMAITYPERSLDHRKWMKVFKNHSAKAAVHIRDWGSWRNSESDVDWSRLGLESMNTTSQDAPSGNEPKSG